MRKWEDLYSDFSEVLSETEDAAEILHDTNKWFKRVTGYLFEMYDRGYGTDKERERAIDQLEDAGLIKHRFTDEI